MLRFWACQQGGPGPPQAARAASRWANRPKVATLPMRRAGPPRVVHCGGAGISRPGPKSMIERRVEALRELSRKDQQFVVKFLDQVLEDYARRKL